MLNINNVHAPNTAFKGYFYNNTLLEKSIERASDYDLYKFSKILKRMANSDDERTFELYKTLDNGKTIIQIYKTKNYVFTKHDVGIGSENPDAKKRTCFDSVIGNVNKFLEKIYREVSIKRILDRLV